MPINLYINLYIYMYNLIEYGIANSKTSECLWQTI